MPRPADVFLAQSTVDHRTGRAAKRPVSSTVSDRFVASACERLRKNEPVRRRLPLWGRLHVDRQLPFLCVYRRPPRGDETGTERLIVGEASYLLAVGDRRQARGVKSLVQGIATVMTESFGSFLILEVWAGDSGPEDQPHKPRFRIHHNRRTDIGAVVEALEVGLRKIRVKNQLADVEIVTRGKMTPPALPALASPAEAIQRTWIMLGLEVRPVNWDPVTRRDFPLIRRALHRGVSRALKQGVFQFTRTKTTHRPRHYQALGQRSIVKAVWEVDRQLAEVSNGFDFLLLSTPTNAEAAWNAFQRSKCAKEPKFTYRPLPIDPPLAKRQLFRVPIERVDDPTLAQLFRDQQATLDRKLTMLADRGSPKFLYGSLQTYGGVDSRLLKVARGLVKTIPARARDKGKAYLDAEAFAARAREEIEHYRNACPDVTSRVEVRSDVSGLMVSRGNLLVGRGTRIPASRAEALLSHEIGTHVVTYFNGKAQPLRQLYVGLPGYDELQEGLAVLSEYLTGGLSRPRLRLLAARVLAVECLTRGALFVDAFRELDHKHGFGQRVAFGVTMRVYRCGGLTKDAVYLRGLICLLDYLKAGGELEPLLIGKFGVDQLPIIKELRWRRVLKPPPLRPRYLETAPAVERLKQLRDGRSIAELTKGRRK